MRTKFNTHTACHGEQMTLFQALQCVSMSDLLPIPIRRVGGFVHTYPDGVESDTSIEPEYECCLTIRAEGNDKYHTTSMIFWVCDEDGPVQHMIELTDVNLWHPTCQVGHHKYNQYNGEFLGKFTPARTNYGIMRKYWSPAGSYYHCFDYMTIEDLCLEVCRE